jgi:hypothetical protein
MPGSSESDARFFSLRSNCVSYFELCSALAQKTCNILILGTIIRVYFDPTLSLESFSHSDSLKEEYLIRAPITHSKNWL